MIDKGEAIIIDFDSCVREGETLSYKHGDYWMGIGRSCRGEEGEWPIQSTKDRGIFRPVPFAFEAIDLIQWSYSRRSRFHSWYPELPVIHWSLDCRERHKMKNIWKWCCSSLETNSDNVSHRFWSLFWLSTYWPTLRRHGTPSNFSCMLVQSV